MPGLGGLAQRLLRLGVSQTLWAGTEQSDASAQIGGAAPEVPPWDWTASIPCSSRNLDVPASGFTDSYGLPGSSQGDTEPTKSPPTPGTVTPLYQTFCNENSLSTSQIKPG